jgi:hypothetical protein
LSATNGLVWIITSEKYELGDEINRQRRSKNEKKPIISRILQKNTGDE